MTPLLTPQEVRARLVDFYMKSYQRMYGHADRTAIERKVIDDLHLVDAARRAPRTPRGPKVKARRADPLLEAQIATGTTLTKSDTERRAKATPYRPRVLHQNPMLISERWGAAVARIARILDGAGGASTVTGAVQNAEIPRLAHRYAETYAYYLTRSKPAPTRGVDHNPFRGLTDKDASRLLMRLTEDICDASTSSLGSWYVR